MLVVAALYTYSRYTNNNNQDTTVDNITGASCLQPVLSSEQGDEQANTTSSSSTTSQDDSSNDPQQQQQQQQQPQSTSTHHHSRRLRRLQRRFSDSFQSARLQTNSLLHTAVGQCHPLSSSSSSGYNNTPPPAATRARAPHVESSSSLYASIPLQGSSSYSLLADHHHHHHQPAAAAAATVRNMESMSPSSPPNSTSSIPVEDVSLNMFPQSVREEWINAVFGPDFCHANNNNNNNISQQAAHVSSPQHGVGHAGIASYTSYTTTIPMQQQQQQPQHGTRTMTTPTPPTTRKLGITINRLPLGLYVRRIASPASEAALLGIQVGDVLVRINGVNVLAEPSRLLLERMWQYEGVVLTSTGTTKSSCSSISGNNAVSTMMIADNHNTRRRRQHNSRQGQARTTESFKSSATAAAAAAADDDVNNGSSNNNNINSPCMMMTDPVAMVFSRHGQLYQVVFLSCGSGSGWGMAWAPCGNFPLVKRSYGLAATSGVQRGSILAAVHTTNNSNGNSSSSSFRQLDHYGMATALSKEFQAASAATAGAGGGEQQDLHLTLCFPPRAARPQRSDGGGVHSFSAPQAVNGNNNPTTTTSSNSSNTRNTTTSLSRTRKRAPQPKRVLRMDDGVEVKFHSLEFTIGGICSAAVSAGGGGNYTSSSSPSSRGRGNSGSSSMGGGGRSRNNNRISDLAEQVAAGAVESPFVKDINLPSLSPLSSSSSQQQLACYYPPCPTLQGKELLDAWDPMESLLYCCAFYKTGYQEDALQDFLNDHPGRLVHDESSSRSSSSNSSSPTIAALHALMNTPHAASMASAFLLQFISVICLPSSEIVTTTPTTATSSAAVTMEEKKTDDLCIVQDETSVTRHHHHLENNAKELTSMLLKLSRRDEGFCQRLYFLLRSYISSIETNRHSTTTTTTATSGCNNKDGSSLTHLMALLNCLELLRFAEKQSVGSHLHHNNNNRVPMHSSLSGSHTSKLVATTTTTTSKTTMEASPMPSAIPASPASSASMEEATSAAAAVHKKKSVLHFLRKKKPSSTKMHPSNKNKISMVSPFGGDRVGQEMPLHQAPMQSITTVAVVTPTLPLSQQQQYGMSSIMSNDNASLSCQSPSVMYENMSDFLSQLDDICSTIERSLQRSFRQKIADWAMQPWSASKDTALASVTSAMRQSLKQANNNNNISDSQRMKLLVNPVESSELLSSVDADECYILPSAHFPILLTFNVSERRRSCDYSPVGEERIYRTTLKLRGLSCRGGSGSEKLKSGSYTVHAAVAGKILASDESYRRDDMATKHAWRSGNNNTLVFDTRSSWGAPQTLSLRLSSSSVLVNQTGAAAVEDASFGWVDLSQLWKECDDYINSGLGSSSSSKSIKCQVNMLSLEAREEMFDEHGESSDQEHEEQQQQAGWMELELEVSTEFVDFGDASNGDFSRKRMLLYKHDDDLRQEDFAVQFIRTCDNILKASGLDMKLLTFQCIPVGTRRGFVEWIPGSVPLSEVCQPFLDSFLESSDNKTTASDDGRTSPSMFAKAGLTKYESLFRLGGSLQSESLRRLAGAAAAAAGEKPVSFANNPVQDYLRSVAYAEDAPYLIRRDVMDTYVKSCAGYSVITYILGVGDRHLDNLLLHQSGSFFHCDYSFLLGSDPKKYLPMRITEDMVNGMGGRSSDNHAKFLSLTSAAFLALRRPEIVRILLSMVRLTECSNLPDMSENQSIDQAILGLRDRLRLDLREDEAVAFMENLIEDSLNSKLWLAVDAIHSLGKKF